MQQQPRTITLKEARARLKCGERFLRDEINRGRIKVYRINPRVVLVDAAKFENYEKEKFTA